MVKNILGVLQNILGVLRVLKKISAKGCRKLISLVEILSAETFSARLSLDDEMLLEEGQINLSFAITIYSR